MDTVWFLRGHSSGVAAASLDEVCFVGGRSVVRGMQFGSWVLVRGWTQCGSWGGRDVPVEGGG